MGPAETETLQIPEIQSEPTLKTTTVVQFEIQ